MKSALALPLSAALLAASPAQANVTAPQRVSPPGLFVAEPGSVAVGAGRTAVLMSGFSGKGSKRKASLVARVGTGSSLGPVQRLASGLSERPVIAVGKNGTAAAAWGDASATRSIRVAVARKSRFGSARTVSPGLPAVLDGVAVAANGSVVVLYRTGDGADGTRALQVSIAPPGKAFGPPITLGRSGNYASVLTTMPNGRVVVAWLDTPPNPLPPPAPTVITNARVLATTLAPDATTFAPATELGSLQGWGIGGPLASAGPGGAAIAWGQEANYRVAPVSSDGTISPAIITPIASGTSEFGVGVQADRTLPMVKRSTQNASPESETVVAASILSTVRSANGTFSPLTTISNPKRIAGQPQVASLQAGTFAAWGQVTSKQRGSVQLMMRPTGGDWTSVRELAAPHVRDFNVRVAGSERYAALTWTTVTSKTENGGPMYLATYRP